MKDKKSLVIGLLCILICIMALGYAMLAQQLNINGRASIDSTWKIEITNIVEKDIVGKATSKEIPSYTSTTAHFNASLVQPGDSITYDVEISNLGTLKAKVDSIIINVEESEAIKYKITGIQNGDKLGVGEKAILSIKVEYDSNVTSQPSVIISNITATINYVQDLDDDNAEISYDYVIGDTITFAGSNWYVIKDSVAGDDYVTLIKENLVTNAELGDYAYSNTYDAMAYYYSDTCHYSGSYNYTNNDMSGCSGHNDYEGSKVKEFLDNQYLPALGSNNLKEVDGYKIRLITTEELKNNLGWNNLSNSVSTSANDSGNSVPTWVYSSMYWTMTPYSDNTTAIWYVDNDSTIYMEHNVSNYRGVRPVINLLKSSIKQ